MKNKSVPPEELRSSFGQLHSPQNRAEEAENTASLKGNWPSTSGLRIFLLSAPRCRVSTTSEVARRDGKLVFLVFQQRPAIKTQRPRHRRARNCFKEAEFGLTPQSVSKEPQFSLSMLARRVARRLIGPSSSSPGCDGRFTLFRLTYEAPDNNSQF